jgi:hypothetical protein
MLDVRMAYLAAEKESISPEEIRRLICRVFASYFCQEWGYETDLLRNLVNALYSARIVEAQLIDENGDGGNKTNVLAFTGADAEQHYLALVKQLYMDNGSDELYANEIATWPEVLPIDAFWDYETLRAVAVLDVGHDMLVSEYTKALAKRELQAGRQ